MEIISVLNHSNVLQFYKYGNKLAVAFKYYFDDDVC